MTTPATAQALTEPSHAIAVTLRLGYMPIPWLMQTNAHVQTPSTTGHGLKAANAAWPTSLLERA